MIEFRDGVVHFSDRPTLLGQQANLSAGGLACQLAADATPPALREVIRFDVLVEGWRCGPLEAEVVFISGGQIGLHLRDTAITQLQQLVDEVKHRDRRLSQALAATAAAVEQQSDDGRPGSSSELDIAAASEPDINPTSTSMEAAEMAPFCGELGGRLGLGTLAELFDASETPPPPAVASLLHVLRYVHQCRATGRLVVRNAQYTKTIWLKSGTPLSVIVSPVKEDEMLGQILLRAHWVSAQDLGHALKWARDHQMGMGTALVQSGRLEQAQLKHALSHQTYRRLENLFNWSKATFAFDQDAELPQGPYHPVTVPRLLCELAQELLRGARHEQLNLMLKVAEDCHPTVEGTPDDLKHLVPSNKTLQVCRRIFDGKRTVRQALSASALGRPKTVRLLLYLQASGALCMHPDPVSVDVTPALVQERLRSLHLLDHFQRLHLEYRAHPDRIGPAFAKRSAVFVAGGPYHDADPASADKITVLLAESRKALESASTRRKFRQRILGAAGLAFFAELAGEGAALARIQGQHKRAARLDEVVADLKA